MRFMVITLALLLSVACCSSAFAGFEPVVTTTFGDLSPEATTTLTQEFKYSKGDEVSEYFVTYIDVGSLDLSQMQIGDVVGSASMSIHVENASGEVIADGAISMDIEIEGVWDEEMDLLFVVSEVDADVLEYLKSQGSDDPTGETLLIAWFGDDPEDAG